MSVPQAATEQHQLSFLGSGMDLQAPPMPQILRGHGVLEEDYTELAKGCADTQSQMTMAFLATCCGGCGFCALCLHMAYDSKIQDLAREFNRKYETRAVSVQRAPVKGLQLVFFTPASAAEAAPSPEVMDSPGEAACSEDPVRKLQHLKVMLDDGLISQQEHDTKKAEILARI